MKYMKSLKNLPTKTKKVISAIGKAKEIMAKKVEKKGVDLIGIVKTVVRRRAENEKEEESEDKDTK